MENNNTKKLDMTILKNKNRAVISSKEALKDVTPINWPEDVLSGKKKIIIG